MTGRRIGEQLTLPKGKRDDATTTSIRRSGLVRGRFGITRPRGRRFLDEGEACGDRATEQRFEPPDLRLEPHAFERPRDRGDDRGITGPSRDVWLATEQVVPGAKAGGGRCLGDRLEEPIIDRDLVVGLGR